MKIKIEINDELIAKYLAGEASPEEAIALDDWLQDPDNRLHFQGMQEMWAVSFPSRSSRPVDVPKAWKKVRDEKNSRPQRLGEAPRSLKLDFLLKIAASVLVILAGGGIFYMNTSSKVADISLDSGDSL